MKWHGNVSVNNPVMRKYKFNIEIALWIMIAGFIFGVSMRLPIIRQFLIYHTNDICMFVRIWLSLGLIAGCVIQWWPRFVRFRDYEVFGSERRIAFPSQVILTQLPKKRDPFE